MCPDCERLKDNPSLTGRYLVHPDDRKRHVVDLKGNAVCPVCGSLWNKEPGHKWDLLAEGKAKRAPQASRGKR